MSERSGRAGLLRVASDALVGSVLPALSGPARYQALMVARVLAIAARDAQCGAHADRQELLGIEPLIPDAGPAEANETADSATHLHAYRRALCSEIRSGRFDPAGSAQEALLEHLAVTTENRLRISNPKVLGP